MVNYISYNKLWVRTTIRTIVTIRAIVTDNGIAILKHKVQFTTASSWRMTNTEGKSKGFKFLYLEISRVWFCLLPKHKRNRSILNLLKLCSGCFHDNHVLADILEIFCPSKHLVFAFLPKIESFVHFARTFKQSTINLLKFNCGITCHILNPHSCTIYVCSSWHSTIRAFFAFCYVRFWSNETESLTHLSQQRKSKRVIFPFTVTNHKLDTHKNWQCVRSCHHTKCPSSCI